jgi:uncharacterized protein YceK
MCKFASFVLTKGEEFWSDKSDSHEKIIAEHNLHADGARGPNILRVEISPTDKIKVWPSLKAWAYKVDQDHMPEWFDAVECEKRTRVALARRYKKGFWYVDANGCTSLTSLDAKDATGSVYANGCTSLTSLDTGRAWYVDASGCTSLTSLDAGKAGYVYANGCTSLTSLDAGKAEYVDASGCNKNLVIIAQKGATVIRP